MENSRLTCTSGIWCYMDKALLIVALVYFGSRALKELKK